MPKPKEVTPKFLVRSTTYTELEEKPTRKPKLKTTHKKGSNTYVREVVKGKKVIRTTRTYVDSLEEAGKILEAQARKNNRNRKIDSHDGVIQAYYGAFKAGQKSRAQDKTGRVKFLRAANFFAITNRKFPKLSDRDATANNQVIAMEEDVQLLLDEIGIGYESEPKKSKRKARKRFAGKRSRIAKKYKEIKRELTTVRFKARKRKSTHKKKTYQARKGRK